ncbi:hypothetical protein EST38_g5623 [Candolleomyces aberdarensis]|uniref:Nephrocystin 3-like N-terminal domain-containing protein n=1 Tax=Candolleomyces aberdarensis TaxID=2316362 RepID=A0A4Q2DJX2_9AGAR|nr:hypothetical protein EST38_g5623 [Candolleomyces aberdarensis]
MASATPPGIPFFSGAHNFHIDQQTIIVNQHTLRDLVSRLNPIADASHTRNIKISPPDSACFPGTRERVIKEITNWADTIDEAGDGKIETVSSAVVVYAPTPHIFWLHGFAGCGKSAVSLKIAEVFEESGRLLASYFFFQKAGDRSTMNRFVVTLASQMASTLPATVPLIEAALEADAGLLNNSVSLTRQLERLVYRPFRAVMEGDILEMALTKGPFLIVIDGLDECDDKPGVEEFIDHMLLFFEENPTIPLRIFVASRVEQHIRERLDGNGVLLCNLDNHLPKKDIKKFLESSFDSRAKRDRVIRAYVKAHGKWPTKLDMGKLLKHIGSSFILASTVFKFIVQSPTREDPLTPMARLPLTLEMNGLDGLYQQTLARSQHVPYFHDIISTITLLRHPRPIVGIAQFLGIEAFQVVHVLLNLQAIVHVPGSDEQGDVTFPEHLTQSSPTGEETVYVTPRRMSLEDSFHVLEWIVNRARFKLEELNAAPRPPLELFIAHDWRRGKEVNMSFDERSLHEWMRPKTSFEPPLLDSE